MNMNRAQLALLCCATLATGCTSVSETSSNESSVHRAFLSAPAYNQLVAPVGMMHFAATPAPAQQERYAHIEATGFQSVLDHPQSTFSVDVDTATYANLRRIVDNGKLPPADAVRIEEMINYFPYAYPQPNGDAPLGITTETSLCPWDPSHRLVRIGVQGRAVEKDQLPSANLVFLIDVSGSMREELPLLRTAPRRRARCCASNSPAPC